MAFYPFVHVSALELYTLSRYPGNRQNDRMTDRNTNRLPHTFAAHAHRGIIKLEDVKGEGSENVQPSELAKQKCSGMLQLQPCRGALMEHLSSLLTLTSQGSKLCILKRPV